jgi:hypothetical protein
MRPVRHRAGGPGRCGTGLADRPVTAVERRPVFDLQPVRAEVTEHQPIERECGSGYRTKALRGLPTMARGPPVTVQALTVNVPVMPFCPCPGTGHR